MVKCEYCNTLTPINGKYWEAGLALCSSKCLAHFTHEDMEIKDKDCELCNGKR